MVDSPPAGFAPWQPTSPFTRELARLGTFYYRDDEDVLAVRVGPLHTNMVSIAHGGMLMTLADCALGKAVSRQAGAAVVTAQMSVEFLRPVRSGDWLEAHMHIDRLGRRLIYATCWLMVTGRVMLKASALFSMVGDVQASGPP